MKTELGRSPQAGSRILAAASGLLLLGAAACTVESASASSPRVLIRRRRPRDTTRRRHGRAIPRLLLRLATRSHLRAVLRATVRAATRGAGHQRRVLRAGRPIRAAERLRGRDGRRSHRRAAAEPPAPRAAPVPRRDQHPGGGHDRGAFRTRVRTASGRAQRVDPDRLPRLQPDPRGHPAHVRAQAHRGRRQVAGLPRAQLRHPRAAAVERLRRGLLPHHGRPPHRWRRGADQGSGDGRRLHRVLALLGDGEPAAPWQADHHRLATHLWSHYGNPDMAKAATPT